jgi:hypothetical protein
LAKVRARIFQRLQIRNLDGEWQANPSQIVKPIGIGWKKGQGSYLPFFYLVLSLVRLMTRQASWISVVVAARRD